MTEIAPPTETLFPGYEPEVREPEPKLSADQRRTKRQADRIALGFHPLTGGGLHELASRHRDASAPKSDPFTCGSCWFRETIRHHDRTYAKCSLGATNEKPGPYETHSAATDVRAWWPACRDYSPSDRISNDAARYMPGGDA